MTSISSGVEILLGLSPPMCPNGRVSVQEYSGGFMIGNSQEFHNQYYATTTRIQVLKSSGIALQFINYVTLKFLRFQNLIWWW